MNVEISFFGIELPSVRLVKRFEIFSCNRACYLTRLCQPVICVFNFCIYFIFVYLSVCVSDVCLSIMLFFVFFVYLLPEIVNTDEDNVIETKWLKVSYFERDLHRSQSCRR